MFRAPIGAPVAFAGAAPSGAFSTLEGMSESTAAAPAVERCLRCGAAMEWRHATWQCPRCRFKLGCCEGESPESCEPR